MNAEDYNKLGKEKNNLKQYKEAVEIYNKAIELYPDYNVLYFERAMNCTYTEEYDKAIADYEKYLSLEKNTDNADYNFISGSVFGIGYIRFKQEMYDEALYLYQQAKAYNITDELRNVINYAAYVCENEKNKHKLLSKLDNLTNEIQGHMEKISRIVNEYEGTECQTNLYGGYTDNDDEPNNCQDNEIVNHTYIKAFAKYNQKEYGEALELFRQCIEELPDIDRIYFYIGNIYEIKSDYINAVKNYTKAIELNSDNLMYLNIRANAYYKNEEYEKALSDWNKIVELEPDYEINSSLKAYAEAILNGQN